jgi:hypothetical protein
MMDLNFSTLGPEAATSLRQTRSDSSDDAQTRPELFDFAGILGGFVSASPVSPSAIPEAIDETPSAEAMAALALKGGGGDTADSLDLSDTGLSHLPSTVGSDPKALGRPRFSSEHFSTLSSAQFRGAVRTPVASGLQIATDQLDVSKGDTQRFDAAAMALLLGSSNSTGGRIEELADGSLGSPHRLNHDGRENGEIDAQVLRLKVTAGVAVQEPTAIDSTLSSLVISVVQPPAPVPLSIRSRLTSQTDSRLTVDADTRSPTMSHEPAPILGIGELLGVAGKLQFNQDSLSTSSTPSIDSQPVITQGGQSQIPLHEVPSLPLQPTISTPLSSPQWPNVFSGSIVRLATEQITEANLTVTPDDLGTINITIALEGNRVSLGFTAENSDVRQAVNASLPVLEAMLEKSGLSLGQSSVGQEAPRDTNPRPSKFGQANGSLRESNVTPTIPVTPPRTREPQLGNGRVDFFA